MSSVEESESTGTGACDGQPLTACKQGSAISNGPDFEARECHDVPEDLSQKSSEFQSDFLDSFQQKCPVFPKEMQSGFNKDRNHHRLRSVLLGISDGKIVLEVSESSAQSQGNSRDTNTWPQNRQPPSCPRTVWTDTCPEHLSQVTFSTYSDARVLDETVISEAEKISRMCDIDSAQDSCELNSSIVCQLKTRTFDGTLESRLGDVPPTRSCQSRVSRNAFQILADSTTNISPTRRSGHYRLTFPNLSLEQIHNQGVLLSPVIRNMNNDCYKNKIHRLSPETQISNANCPQKNAAIKLNLKSLLSQDVVRPPGEHACNYINGSGVNKRTSTQAPEDKRFVIATFLKLVV